MHQHEKVLEQRGCGECGGATVNALRAVNRREATGECPLVR